MAAATERIIVLVDPDEKESITRAARAINLSVGEYMRRAAASYTGVEDSAALARLLEIARSKAEQTADRLDQTLSTLEGPSSPARPRGRSS
jgi:uncharacterized protein (DUF1778 family)